MGDIQEFPDVHMEIIRSAVQQIRETYDILNSTVKPDIFFGRLGFLFDRLLMLQKYEKYGVFTENNPTKRILDIQNGLEGRIDRFVDRYMEYVYRTVSAKKTERGRANTLFDLTNKLISAFDCAENFWTGSKGFPHYDGPFFTEQNYRRVETIYDEVCDVCDKYVDDDL